MILYDTNFLQLKSTKTQEGKEWVYAHRPNANNVVIILPIINNEQVLFLKEHRPPLLAEKKAKYSIALPAGLVGDEREGETIEEAIKAELLEETGLIADKIEIKTRNVASSPGCVSETCTISIAYIKEYNVQQKPVSDGGIIVDRYLVEKSKIKEWLKEEENNGAALTGQTLAALFFLEGV